MRSTRTVLAALAAVAVLAACSSGPQVTYGGAASQEPLRVLVGGEGYRDVVQHVIDEHLAGDVQIELVDAGDDANAQVTAGTADLAFYQTQPAFLGEEQPTPDLSIVSKVDVVPYGLYSTRWTDVQDTESWENAGIVEDSIVGTSLPHGAVVVVPNTTAGYARGLYLLQSAGLATLDREFGGLTVQDLSITDANVRDSNRHLDIEGLAVGDGLATDLLRNYDAVVMDAITATAAGLVPERDALATEPAVGNPYARVVVAPSRLAGDPRVSALVHALESPQVADYLAGTYHGTYLPAFPTGPSTTASTSPTPRREQ